LKDGGFQVATQNGNAAVRRELLEDPSGKVLGFFEPGFVLRHVIHSGGSIDDNGGSNRGILCAERSHELGNHPVTLGHEGDSTEFEHRSGEGESQKRKEQNTHREEQNMFQPIISAMHLDFLEDKHHRGKLNHFRLPLHEQMQQHRHGCRRHPAEK
jgi:hypothetical protein